MQRDAFRITTFSMAHEGTCYKNSNLNPSGAEEHEAAMVYRELLLDSNGKYVDNEEAIYCPSFKLLR